MPPSTAPSDRADEPEVSSRRVSPSSVEPKSSAPTSVRPGELKDLLERASISEDHRALMSTVIGRISSAESGLHNAVSKLPTASYNPLSEDEILSIIVLINVR